MNPNMTPIDWAKRPLQKYADFSGRAPRAEYWWFYLFVVLGCIAASIIDSILGLRERSVTTASWRWSLASPCLFQRSRPERAGCTTWAGPGGGS